MTAALVTPALAAYPEKPVTIIVPFPPGGSTDMVARAIAPKLQAQLGQPFVIDNRAGATGAIGATAVKNAAPDGYTFLVASIGVYAINPFIQKKLQYDPVKDLDLITVAVRAPNVLVASPNFPANSVAELLAVLKKSPDKITFASSGAGSSDHLTAALFWQKTGTSGIHVPYKGGAPAITDLLAGHADVSFQNINAVIGHIKAGKLKALAVTSEQALAAAAAGADARRIGRAGRQRVLVAGDCRPEGHAGRRQAEAARRDRRGAERPREPQADGGRRLRDRRQHARADGAVPGAGAGALEAGDPGRQDRARVVVPDTREVAMIQSVRPTGSPRVAAMRVIPVAGRDSMLLNLSGAHGPFFTRNLVVLTDDAGRTGVGEVPGGEKIRMTLEDARALVDRTADRRRTRILNEVRAASPTATPAGAASRPSTCGSRSTR